MKLNFQIGKKTKWILVALGLIAAGIVSGNMMHWDEHNGLVAFSVITIITGFIVGIVMLIIAIHQDFDT